MNKKTLTLIIVMFLVVIMGIILGYYIVNSKKTNEVNLKDLSEDVNVKELIEDIKSIKKNGKIIHAKEKDPYTIPSTYYGDGYYITISLGRDYTDYFIYSNNKEIWHYTKTLEQ